MRTHLLLATSATSLLLALPGFAQTKYPATLQSHAILPAMTLVSPPGDAPKELQISGRYSGPPGQRVDTPESVPAMSALSDKTAPRPTGLYKIDTAQADADGFVKKIGYIDLMDIQDPDKASRQGRQVHFPILHHRERRPGERRSHRRRQRQQPALLVGPGAGQG